MMEKELIKMAEKEIKINRVYTKTLVEVEVMSYQRQFLIADKWSR